MKHIKREWNYEIHECRCIFRNPHIDVWFDNLDETFNVTKEEGLANAKLISAAPDLFEALIGLVSDIDSTNSDLISLRIDQAKEAIKKATE